VSIGFFQLLLGHYSIGQERNVNLLINGFEIKGKFFSVKNIIWEQCIKQMYENINSDEH